MESCVTTGSRVLVQFGRRKYYTGIVESLSTEKPEGFEVKPVMLALDKDPVIRYPQLKFWHWIADYYLCTPGEVYKAALPSGLKVESETFIILNPDYDPSLDSAPLPDTQMQIIDVLQNNGKMRVAELEEKTHLKSLGKIVNDMLAAGIIEIDEKIVERYRTRKESFVRLTIARDDEDSLHAFMDSLRRSPKGERLLLAYLTKSRWFARNEPVADIEKKDLLESTATSAAVLKGLVDKGILEIYTREVNRFKQSPTKYENTTLPPLSEAQQRAEKDIRAAFKEKQVVLLHGVTGSGKTEIYMRLISKAIERGQQSLILVPEISLTTQLTDRLRKVFGSKLLVYHSKFTDAERVETYRAVLDAESPKVVLGVRSSVFLPFTNLGLIIVDEEHESSFKQYDPAPRYNARDAAIVLATMHGAKVLLGSATPSVETYYKAESGKYGLVTLTQRYGGASLPTVEIIDMRDQRRRKRSSGIFSEPLILATKESLKGGRQAIFFQNRRGFAPMVICSQCGWTPRCPNCDVAPVYHKNIGRLECHYCGQTDNIPHVCPACGQNSVETYGYGTERIAEDVEKLFSGSRVARMDLDTTRNKNAYQEIIESFSEAQTDILVGTQMVSKGLDFGRVDIVGVLNADTILNFPDFRSDERAFCMLEQVAGRAGRRSDHGRVIIQTHNPEHPVLEYVKAHDYGGFYRHELAQRENFRYPPFRRIVNIYFKHKHAATCESVASAFTAELQRIFGNRVLGPERPPVSRISSYYIQCTMLKIEANAAMKKVKDIIRKIAIGLADYPGMKTALIYYDVDPV